MVTPALLERRVAIPERGPRQTGEVLTGTTGLPLRLLLTNHPPDCANFATGRYERH